jgi:hypothetical protein
MAEIRQRGRLRVGFEAAGAGRLSTQSRARFAGMAVDHLLAGRSSLSVNELTDERSYGRGASRDRNPRTRLWAVNPRPDGREPVWGPDLSWVPLADVDPLRVALAWRERDSSPLVAAFAAVVRETAAAGEPRC